MAVWTKAALAAGVLLVASGCGGGGGGDSFADKPVKDITTAASADMKDLKSLRISGDLTTSGQDLKIDMKSTTDGDCQGSVQIDDGTAEIVSSEGTYWMRPDHAFWQQQAPDQSKLIEQAIGDKWVTVPSNSGLDEVCDLDNFLKSFNDASTDDPSASPSNAGSEQVDGQDAVKISGTSDGQEVAAWVATGDKHYILKLEVGGGGDGGTLSFSDFDEPFDVKTPDPSDVADLSSVGG